MRGPARRLIGIPRSSLQQLQRPVVGGLRSSSYMQSTPPSPKPPASENNYQAWQHEDLVRRVHELEQKLHLQTQSVKEERAVVQNGERYKKPKKAPKRFDSSKYTTRKIALKFAYLGARYNGFEHHSNNKTPLPTVEEVVWKALVKTKLIFPEHKPGQNEDEVCWTGCEYSKCGRTDKGVSAFGQVIALRARSAQPVPKPEQLETELGTAEDGEEESQTRPFDPIEDELPYVQLLNRVLPPDIRVLAWCAASADFSARFSCRERRYRYFFTNPAYLPTSGGSDRSMLDIEAMQKAAAKYQGLHDFRNLCMVDPSKQITDWRRRVFRAGVHAVDGESMPSPKMYYFEVRGSAFLWHQVRDLVAILFLVGQGYETPDIVDKLLDVEATPRKPVYDMASDLPLVLWDCIFPDLSAGDASAHSTAGSTHGYTDALPWIYAGEAGGGQDALRNPAVGGPKYDAGSIREDIWSIWQTRKLNETLASQLMQVVAAESDAVAEACDKAQTRSDRVFDGSERPRNVGTYVPVMQRARLEPPDVLNARYAARKSREDLVDE